MLTQQALRGFTMSKLSLLILAVFCLAGISAFGVGPARIGVRSSAQSSAKRGAGVSYRSSGSQLQMNFFEDASRFFSNMNKEASAKHILMKGNDARSKLQTLKEELADAEDLSSAFSDLAAKVSECPSANRGGNLGTFKPGMMVKEFDKIVFEEEVGKVHGPVSTQFGEHLILITRRFEGEDKKKKK